MCTDLKDRVKAKIFFKSLVKARIIFAFVENRIMYFITIFVLLLQSSDSVLYNLHAKSKLKVSLMEDKRKKAKL